MIEINISKGQIERAKQQYAFYNINNSFTKGESQIYGALGEIIFKDYYDLKDCSYIGDKDYDFLYKNKKIEIKTKKTSVQPRPYYLCSISINSLTQKCDEYVFVRILKDMSRGWICGWITKKDFFDKGFYGREGDVDPSSNDDFRFKEDCLNVPITELRIEYSGNITIDFLKKNFKISQETPFILTEYKRLKELNGGELNVRIVYEPETNKLTVQELNRGNLFNGYIHNQKQFIYLFDKLLKLNF